MNNIDNKVDIKNNKKRKSSDDCILPVSKKVKTDV